MSSKERIGIIDIGSNSIRLVIYEIAAPDMAFRVIDESKEAARLSERIRLDGTLADEHIEYIVDILRHFRMLCAVHRVNRIRAVATAAIRNAANSGQIVRALTEASGLSIDVLTGEEEAYAGFLGMINTMDISDGLLVDIGGGSTEITMFSNRSLKHSVSLPFGSVNTSRRFGHEGNFTDTDIARIRQMVQNALEQHPWIRSAGNLPLIGLGGTIRSIGKISQRIKKYSLPLSHNYSMSGEEMTGLVQRLAQLELEHRKKIDGLSSSRADIIVPGAVILHTIGMYAVATHYIISGSGLRDGLLHETVNPDNPVMPDVLRSSVRNLLALHPAVPLHHIEQVNRIASQLYQGLRSYAEFPDRAGLYLEVSAFLYRIGITVNYYDYRQHSFYLIAHSQLNGLSHREILLCAMIASYKSKSRARGQYMNHKDLLGDADLQLAVRLGSLLNVAIALDRSETQPVTRFSMEVAPKELRLHCAFRHNAAIEKREVGQIAKDFKKVWGLQIKLQDEATST